MYNKEIAFSLYFLETKKQNDYFVIQKCMALNKTTIVKT